MNFPAIYLASNSPRRRELLDQIGVPFSVLSVDVDEAVISNETPDDYVRRVALAKAQAGFACLEQDVKPVLGADTAVIVDGAILGKPKNDADAQSMLQRLSNTRHQVLSVVAVVTKAQLLYQLSSNYVTFTKLSPEMIAWYISTKEGCDKAGSYAVQGLAAQFICKIEGSYSGIMGLPLWETTLLLKKIKECGNE